MCPSLPLHLAEAVKALARPPHPTINPRTASSMSHHLNFCDTPTYVQALSLIQQTAENLQSQPIDQPHSTCILDPSTLAILLELCTKGSGSIQFGDGLSWSAKWELDSTAGTLTVHRPVNSIDSMPNDDDDFDDDGADV